METIRIINRFHLQTINEPVRYRDRLRVVRQAEILSARHGLRLIGAGLFFRGGFRVKKRLRVAFAGHFVLSLVKPPLGIV